jgi:hypothetical protein
MNAPSTTPKLVIFHHAAHAAFSPSGKPAGSREMKERTAERKSELVDPVYVTFPSGTVDP